MQPLLQLAAATHQHAPPCSSLCGLPGWIKLHYVGDGWEVEPPGCHISAQQHPRRALCEEQEGLGALRLQQVGEIEGSTARPMMKMGASSGVAGATAEQCRGLPAVLPGSAATNTDAPCQQRRRAHPPAACCRAA